MSEKDPLLNLDYRLLFIEKNGIIASYMEYLLSKKDLSYLQDTQKASYLKKDGSFEGTIILEDSKNEFSTIYHSTGNSQELRLKNVPVVCVGLYELYDDGSSELIEILYCTSSGGGDDGGGGGGGGGSTNPTTNPTPTPAPDNPILSIQDYLKCINSNSSATITIYVDQPVANSSAPYSGVNVGHAFVGISQGSNTSIFGFYPKNYAKPGSTTDESTLGDDSNHSIDVSVSKNVTQSQLAGILYYANNHSGTYDLNNCNCTDFAIAIGNLAGMNLPDTPGTWPGGGGSNPGALGQDIRSMTLSSGMNRNTSGGIISFECKKL